MRIFITSTDTDAGKTAVTFCLARAAREYGTTQAIKPVASGTIAGQAPEDALHIARGAGHEPTWWIAYTAATSPHRAALLEQRHAPLGLIQQASAVAQQKDPPDVLLMEGVGGLRVPIHLDPDIWLVDLARAFNGRTLVVAPNRIGVLNHTLLTVQAAQSEGLDVAGVVLNDVPGTPDASQPHNAEDLRRLVDVPVAQLETLDLEDDHAVRNAGMGLWHGIFPRVAANWERGTLVTA